MVDCLGLPMDFVLVRVLHDEATMRLRSQLPAAPAVEHGLAAVSALRRVPFARPFDQDSDTHHRRQHQRHRHEHQQQHQHCIIVVVGVVGRRLISH